MLRTILIKCYSVLCNFSRLGKTIGQYRGTGLEGFHSIDSEIRRTLLSKGDIYRRGLITFFFSGEVGHMLKQDQAPHCKWIPHRCYGRYP